MNRTNCIELTSTGPRSFRITNGADAFDAVYVYGSGSGKEKIGPHWDVTENGETVSVFKAKDAVVEELTGRLTDAIGSPLKGSLTELAGRDGHVHGIVAVTAREMLDAVPEDFPALLAGKLLEYPPDGVLANAWRIVAVDTETDTFHVRVEVKTK